MGLYSLANDKSTSALAVSLSLSNSPIYISLQLSCFLQLFAAMLGHAHTATKSQLVNPSASVVFSNVSINYINHIILLIPTETLYFGCKHGLLCYNNIVILYFSLFGQRKQYWHTITVVKII